MGSRTVSLEESAYAKLRAAKRPGESFSEVVHRILAGAEPPFADFRALVDRTSADRLADVIAKMRREDVQLQRKRLGRRG